MNKNDNKKKNSIYFRDIKNRVTYIEIIDDILKRFFQDIIKSQSEALKSKAPKPIFIKNASDLEMMIKLHIFLLGEATALERAIGADPELTKLLTKIYRRTHRR